MQERASNEFSTQFSSRGNDALAIEYLTWCRDTRNRSPETLRAYGGVLEAFATWADGTPVLEYGTTDLEAFVGRPRGGRAMGRIGSPATRKKDVSVLRSFYQWAEDRGYVARSPARMLHAPTVHNENPHPIDDADWLRWLAVDLPTDLRGVLGLGFYCGLRRAEIVSLRREQVTPSKLRDFKRKGGGQSTLPWLEMAEVYADRLPELMPDAEAFASTLRVLATPKTSDPLLPWAILDPQEVNRRIDKAAVKWSLPRFTPHQLRHSCATNLLRAGVPLHLVSRLLNHASTTTTMRYVRAGADELREWRRGL